MNPAHRTSALAKPCRQSGCLQIDMTGFALRGLLIELLVASCAGLLAKYGGWYLISNEELQKWVSPSLIEEARRSMDLQTISAFKFDKRGRIEAGIKPAPPSTVAPSYARLTKRGRRFFPDCRTHGKDHWCLHVVILALHHLGVAPKYRQMKPPAKPSENPLVGFRLVLGFDEDRAQLQIFSLAGRSVVGDPLRYLKREAQIFGLEARALELLEDLSDAHRSHLCLAIADLAPVLAAMHGVALYTGVDGAARRWQLAAAEPPKLQVSLDGDWVTWEWLPPMPSAGFWVPGRPGFLVTAETIVCYRAYVARFPDEMQAAKGRIKLSAKVLHQLLSERHQMVWKTAKPALIETLSRCGLKLAVETGQLQGRFGLWHEARFLAIANLDDPLQILRDERRQIAALLHLNAMTAVKTSAAVQAIRAPWQDTAFTIREHAARAFLENLRVPESWQMETAHAEQWFGSAKQEITCQWPGEDGAAPHYHIGGERFEHGSLMDALLPGNRGARLADGRHINADFSQLLTNEYILAGVRELHSEPAARQSLLQRILDPRPDRPSEVLASQLSLSETWQQCLRPYQKDGVSWLLANYQRREPALLADEMGLGKTVQTLAFLDTVHQSGQCQLLVVPTSLLQNWLAECRRFCPHRHLYVHHGSNRHTNAAAFENEEWVITSYGTLRRDIEMLYDVAFHTVVLDEAQAVKNAASQTASAVSELWCEHRIALTGTPIENSLTELWAIFQFLAPDYLGTEDDIKAIGWPGTPRFQALKAKAGPFLLRRQKSVVEPDLPPKQEITVSLPLSPEQQQLYHQLRTEVKNGLLTQTGGQAPNTVSILTKLLRLRQVSCHPGLLEDSLLSTPSNKFAYLLERLSETAASGTFALVFSQFTSLLKLLRFELEEIGMDYLYLDGKTRNRQDLVDRFQAGEAPVFLISLKAGGTGLNLTKASYVYHLDPWWNPMAEAQATDRAHRIGQTRKVMSYKIISQGTIEENILKLQASKKVLAEGLWQEGMPLDRDTLLSLLG